jgi:hypothetical protein
LEEKKKVRIKKRRLTFRKGPFEFRYIAIYRAEEGDKFWSFIALEQDGYLETEPFPRNQFTEFIQKYGAQAKAAAYGEARKLMRVHSVLST